MIDEPGSYYICTEMSPRCYVIQKVSAKNIQTVCDTLNQAYNTLSSMGNLSPDDTTTALGYAGSCGNDSGGLAAAAADTSPAAGHPPLPLPWWFGPDCEQQFDPLNHESAGEQAMGLVYDSTTGESSTLMTNNMNSDEIVEASAVNNCQNTDHNNNNDIDDGRQIENSASLNREHFSLVNNDSQGLDGTMIDQSSSNSLKNPQPVAETLRQKNLINTNRFSEEERKLETSQKSVVQQTPTLLISGPNDSSNNNADLNSTGPAPSSIVSDTPTVTASGGHPPPAAPLSNSSSSVVSTPADDAELRARLKAQLEWYFSRENLAVDTYLRSQMDNDQFVPIRIVATFNMVKKLTSDYDLIVQLYRESPLVQVDEKGEKVRPVHKRCTLILREIPDGTKKEEIEALFASPKCPKVVSCEFAHNNSWYINFESDEHAQAAYVFLQKEAANIRGKAVKARIKTAPIPRIQTSAPPPRPGAVTYGAQLSHNSGMTMSPAESLPNGMSPATAAPTFIAATPGSLDGSTPHTALIFVPDAAVVPPPTGSATAAASSAASTSNNAAAVSTTPATIVAASPVLTPPWPGATPFFDLGQIFALNGFQAQGTFRPSVHTVLVPATPLAPGPMPGIPGHGRHPHYDRSHRNRRNNNYGGGYTPPPNGNNNQQSNNLPPPPPPLPLNPSDRSSSATTTTGTASSSFDSNNRQRMGGVMQNGVVGGSKPLHVNNWSPSGQNDARNYHYNPRPRHNYPPNDPPSANQHGGPPGAYRGGPPGETPTNNGNPPASYHRYQNNYGGGGMPRMRNPYNNNNRYQQQGHYSYRGDDGGQGGQQPPNDPRHPNADYWSSKMPNYVKDRQRNSNSPNDQQHNQSVSNQNANFVSGIRKGSGQSLNNAVSSTSNNLRPGHVNERRRTTGGAIPSSPAAPSSSQIAPLAVASEFDFQPSSFPPLPAPKSDIETSASSATAQAKNSIVAVAIEERNRLPSANESETSTATLVATGGATSPKISTSTAKNSTIPNNNEENTKTFSKILTRNVGESATTTAKSSWPAVGESSAKKETTPVASDQHSALPPQASWGQASKTQKTVTTADKSTTTDSPVRQRKVSSSSKNVVNQRRTSSSNLDDETTTTDDETLVFSENNTAASSSSLNNKNLLKVNHSAKKSSFIQNGPVEEKPNPNSSTAVKLSYAAMAKQAVEKPTAAAAAMAPSTSAVNKAPSETPPQSKNPQSHGQRLSPFNTTNTKQQTTSHNNQNANNNNYSVVANGPFYKRQNSSNNDQANSTATENVRHSVPPVGAVDGAAVNEQRRLSMGSSNLEVGQSATMNPLRKYPPIQKPSPRPPVVSVSPVAATLNQANHDDSIDVTQKKSPAILDAN